jgi:hypothetical protein
MQRHRPLTQAGIDARAIKPTETNLATADLGHLDVVTVDYEGPDSVPSMQTLASLAERTAVRRTVPVRADGFDPLGDASRLNALPAAVNTVLVAGHPVYLSPAEESRAVAPRLRAAADQLADPWVGTEGIERLALAVGGTQFDLLSPSTAADVRALRTAGFSGEIAVYAPTVLSDDDSTLLDALGGYVARRREVRASLPADPVTDSSASEPVRSTLREAIDSFALVGTPTTVAKQVATLREAGVSRIVAYRPTA